MNVDRLGPIARKFLKRLREFRGRRDHDLAAVITGGRRARALQKTVAGEKRLAGFHPAHAIYVYAQNQVSVLSEQVTELPELAPFVRLIAPAEEEYMPGGPPMSPLTASYFTSWAFFDAAVGAERETIGTCILALLHEVDDDSDYVHVVEQMQKSRMGLYVQQGRDGEVALLRELVTDETVRCIVPSGHSGRPGELWYARILPPPLDTDGASVAFTTPYVVVRPGVEDWLAYLRRTPPRTGESDERRAYETLMKYGLDANYWNEYVFEAYDGHRAEAIFLAGLPDVAESRPHSSASKV